MAKNLLKSVEGIDIFIDDETGKFSAEIGGRKISRGSLSDIEKELRKNKEPVKLYSFGGYHSSPSRPREEEILGFERDGRARRKDGSLDRFSRYFILSEKDLSKIEEFNKRQEDLEEEWISFFEKLTEVDRDNIDEIREDQKKSNP